MAIFEHQNDKILLPMGARAPPSGVHWVRNDRISNYVAGQLDCKYAEDGSSGSAAFAIFAHVLRPTGPPTGALGSTSGVTPVVTLTASEREGQQRQRGLDFRQATPCNTVGSCKVNVITVTPPFFHRMVS